MTDAQDRQTTLCGSCGRPNSDDVHFCAECGAPLTRHATTDPVASIYAEGFVIRKAMSEPQRPIVLIGMWLWLGPVFLAFLGLSVLVGGLLMSLGVWIFGFVILAFLLLMTGAIGRILYRTTKSYYVARGIEEAARHHAGDAELSAVPSVSRGRPSETMTCLACGSMMPDESSTCAACGWSYDGDS